MTKNNTKKEGRRYIFRIDTNKIVSALALIVSLCVAVFTVWNESIKQTQNNRQELTSVLEQIADIDRQMVEYNSLPGTMESKDFGSFSFANRRILLLRRADELYRSIGAKTTPEDAAMMSVAYSQSGKIGKAQDYMRIYLNKVNSRFDRSIGYRSLANFAIIKGEHSQAQNLYLKALEELNSPQNESELNLRMSITLFRSMHHIMIKDYKNAAINLTQLIHESRKLMCSPSRGLWIKRLVSMIKEIRPHTNVDIDIENEESGNEVRCIHDPPSGYYKINNTPGNKAFLGAYTFQNNRLRVFLWNKSTLALAIPGQILYLLTPKNGDGQFKVSGLSDYSVLFRRGENRGVIALEFVQPNGRFYWTKSE